MAVLVAAWLWWPHGGISVVGERQGVATEVAGEILPGRPVGQTFVARRDGLDQVDLRLATYARRNSGRLVFRLLEWPGGHEVASDSVSLGDVRDNAYHHFRFRPIVDSAGRTYRVVLESVDATPGNAATAWYSTDDTYRAGEADVAGSAMPGDLAFGIGYLYSWSSLLGDTVSGVRDSAVPIAWALALLLAPGAFAQAVAGARERADPFGRLALACGLTTAVLPLLLLWSTRLSLTLERRSATVLVLALLAGTVVAVAARRRWWRLRGKVIVEPGVGRPDGADGQDAADRTSALPSWATLALLGLAVWSRMFAAREVPVGLWGDSYHHTMIAQLIASGGRVPDSYLPYAPLTTFTYHYGFHSLVAFVHWVTDFEVTRAVVLVGQGLSALAVAGVYYLAVVLTGSRWVGLAGGLVAGLVSPMPAYYLNWGRFTQLAGQTILPFAMALTMRAGDRGSWRDRGLAAVLVGGLIVTHFRVAAFYIAFVGAYLLCEAIRLRSAPRDLLKRIVIVGEIGLGGVVLALPWVWNQGLHLLPRYLNFVREAPISSPAWLEQYNAMGHFGEYVGYEVLVAAMLGLLIGVVWYRRGATLIAVWVAGLLVMANPARFGLPGTGTITNFTIQIAMYLPSAVAAGMGLGLVAGKLRGRLAVGHWALLVGVLIAGLGGAGSGLSVRDEQFALVRGDDLRAMAWIREHTPADARFLVNAMTTGGGGIVVGTDAGWWLPLLARRENTVPPATYPTEDWADPDLGRQVKRFATEVLPAPTAPQSIELLRRYGVTHVYVGVAGGPLSPAELAASPAFELIHRDGDAYVFRLR